MAVELVLLTPLMVAFALLMVALGRYVEAQNAVEGAARDAARAASLERSTAAARTTATDVAAENLASVPAVRDCVTSMPGTLTPGVPIEVEVECRVRLDGLGLLGLPGSVPASGTAVAIVDRFTGVSP
jgi:Flp pilus assembly protein TadG